MGHNPLPRTPGGQGGGVVGEPGEGASIPGGDGVGPSAEGSSTGAAEAHAAALTA